MSHIRMKKVRQILSLCLALLLLSLSLFALSSCGSPTVMTIGGAEVSYDMLRSFVKTYLSTYTEEELAQEDVRQEIRDYVMSDLKKAYAVRALAEELDLKLNSATKDAIEEEMDYYRSIEDYETMLVQMYATDEVFEELVTLTYYDDAVFDMLVSTDSRFASDNDTIDADLESGEWYAAEYVILTVDETNREARREDLEEARQAILNGASMRTATERIYSLYGSEYVYATDGCFTTTIYSEVFEETIRALEIGSLSEIVETTTSDGYPCLMLLRRTKISEEYVDNNYNTIIAYYQAREYATYMEEYTETLDVVFQGKYKDMDILDIE